MNLNRIKDDLHNIEKLYSAVQEKHREFKEADAKALEALKDLARYLGVHVEPSGPLNPLEIILALGHTMKEEPKIIV